MLESRRGAGCESVRAGALGCLLGRGAPCVRPAGGARPPSLPQCLPGPPSWRPHLSVCPGLGSGWTGSQGYQARVGTPGGSPSSRVHMASGLHTLAPPSCPFVPRRKPGPGGHGGGGRGCLLLPALTAPSARPGSALGTAGCAGRHALGGRQRKEHSTPCADGPRRAPAAPDPSPLGPPTSVE